MASVNVLVVASLVLRDNKVLLCQRPAHKEHAGHWELPAGRVEPREDLGAAVTRLMAKGFGVKVTYVAVPVWKKEYPERSLKIVFTPVEFEGEPHCVEHTGYRWETPQDALRLDLSSLVRTFVETVLIRQTDNTLA